MHAKEPKKQRNNIR